MPTEWIMVGLGVAGFLIHAGVTLVTVSRWLFSLRNSLSKDIADHKIAVNETITSIKLTAADEVAVLRRETGETIGAIRQKVQEVELWARDNLVRKDSFAAVIDRIERSVETMTENIDKRLDRMDAKLDRLNGEDRR